MGLLNLQALTGFVLVLALSWALSENRKAFPWRVALAGIVIQIALALAFLHVPVIKAALLSLNAVVDALQVATREGTSFVFGLVGGSAPPFDVKNWSGLFSFAFQALPMLMVISALSALLWHWRVMLLVVKAFAFALERALRIGGAVAVSCAANIWLGTIEAPLLIKPYLERLSRSELFIVLTCSMANVAGTVMVIYAVMLRPVAGDAALGHLLVASILSLPASIIIAMIMVPGERVTPADAGVGRTYRSSIDAVASGASEGLSMYLQIIALLIVMIALVALANMALGLIGPVWGAPLTFQRILGWAFAPAVWAIGIPWGEAFDAGALMGIKTILNEFIAYLGLAALPPEALSPRSELIMIYALCGFANLGSVGIMIAGVTVLAPSRRDEIVQLSGRALVSGTLSSMMVGATIGLITPG